MAAILEYDIWIGDTLGRGEELDGWWIGSLRHSQKTWNYTVQEHP